MLTIISVAVVFIAFVQTIVHWKIVREAFLWASAAVALLALLGSVTLFGLALIYLDTGFALMGVFLMAVAEILFRIEELDREAQFANWRAYVKEIYK
jgi:hypothetical protein